LWGIEHERPNKCAKREDEVEEVYHLDGRDKGHNLLVEKFAQLADAKLLLAGIELKVVRFERRARRFILGVVVGSEVGMLEEVLDRRPVLGVKGERAGEKVEGVGACVGKKGGKGAALADRKRADVLARAAGGDAVVFVEAGGAEDVEDEGELVVVVPAGKERAGGEQLGEDAADGPDVDGLGVAREGEHDLRRAVPARCDVLGHKPGFVARARVGGGADAAGEAKVADFEVAVGVDEQVGGFEIAMDELCVLG
jgi:hypothetical protein